MRRSVILLFLLAATSGSGCTTMPTHEERWRYIGPDAKLQQAHTISPHDYPGGFPQYNETLRQKHSEAIEAAKDACARETGDSRTPGYWIRYSGPFIACMQAQGWVLRGGI